MSFYCPLPGPTSAHDGEPIRRFGHHTEVVGNGVIEPGPFFITRMAFISIEDDKILSHGKIRPADVTISVKNGVK